MKKLTFTRRSLEGIADNKDAERDLKRFRKFFKRGSLVPESVWTAANMRDDRMVPSDLTRPVVCCAAVARCSA